MRVRLPAIPDTYRLAWHGTRHLSTLVGYGLAYTVADTLWAQQRLRRSTTGVGQLRRNLTRILPAGAPPRTLHRATRVDMCPYMHYFYEAFALPGITPEQTLAHVRTDIDPQLREDMHTDSVVITLSHMGNWGLIGTWACRELTTALTVAERLEPEGLFEQFVSFRQSLGICIVGQSHGEKVFDRFLEAASQGHYVIALLADRDLSLAGITTRPGDATARVTADPAAITQRLGRPLYAASIHYEPLTGQRRRRTGSPRGIALAAHRVSASQQMEKCEQVVAYTRAWVAALEPLSAEHAEDWYMLQPVFDADLGQECLAHSHARNRQDAHEENA